MISSPLRGPSHGSRLLVLVLSALVLLASGCAHMSKPKIGIGGTDENIRQVGH